mmetsp:Transcript_29370/g.74473  ORF Transcript_29370/g.74473 Transcript_29370/m.74473 type:complete len:250 (-) Transcript_29370:157-906(-)
MRRVEPGRDRVHPAVRLPALLRRQRRADVPQDQGGPVQVPLSVLGQDLLGRQGLRGQAARGRPQEAHGLQGRPQAPMARLRAHTGLDEEPFRRLGQARARGRRGARAGGRRRRRHDAADVHRLQHRPEGRPGHGGAAQGLRPAGRRGAAAQVALRAREPARRLLRHLVPPVLHRRAGQEARRPLQRARQVCQGEALQDVAGPRPRDPPHHQGRHRTSVQRLHRSRRGLQGHRATGQDRRRRRGLRGVGV